jgi:hypothetical protein
MELDRLVRVQELEEVWAAVAEEAEWADRTWGPAGNVYARNAVIRSGTSPVYPVMRLVVQSVEQKWRGSKNVAKTGNR